MAKKKKRKNSDDKAKGYSVELTGLIIVLIGIIGFGFGIVGAMIKKFAIFLVGEFWFALLILLVVIGIMMLFRRNLPNFKSAKWTGIFILLAVILILAHATFIKNNYTFTSVLNATKDNYMERIATINGTGPILSSGQSSISVGGGIIGSLLAGGLVQLFGYIGTMITISICAIFGIVLFFDINLAEVFTNIKDYIVNTFFESDDDEEDNDEEEQDKHVEEVPITKATPQVPDADNKVIITSVDELKQRTGFEQPREIPVTTGETISSSEQQEDKLVFVNDNYRLPDINKILDPIKKDNKTNSTEFIRSNKNILERVLKEFGIEGKVVEIHMGPAVTQYEVHIPAGTKLSRIVSLDKEIALGMAAKSVKIEAPIPGKSTVGIEIPNKETTPVSFSSKFTSLNPNVALSLST